MGLLSVLFTHGLPDKFPQRYDAPIRRRCEEGEILKIDGSCVKPQVSQKVYAFVAPPVEVPEFVPPAEIPDPKIEYSVVFVRTPEQPDQPDPIVVPSPQQQSVVYVLNKNKPVEQKVIEAPSHPPLAPEVFYINYKDGENPELPGGIDADNAFRRAEVGQVIDIPRIASSESVEASAERKPEIAPNRPASSSGVSFRPSPATFSGAGAGNAISIAGRPSNTYSGPSAPASPFTPSFAFTRIPTSPGRPDPRRQQQQISQAYVRSQRSPKSSNDFSMVPLDVQEIHTSSEILGRRRNILHASQAPMRALPFNV